MTLPGLLASCARQDGDIQKIPTLSYVSYPYLKSQAVWALYLSHTENEIEKNGGGGVQRPHPQPLRVKRVKIPTPKFKKKSLTYENHIG